MPEFTDACSEICSTPEPRNGFSFSKIHHQVMTFSCLVSKSCRREQGQLPHLCLSLLLPKILRREGSRGWACEWGLIIQGGFSPRKLLLVGMGSQTLSQGIPALSQHSNPL